MSVWVWMMLGLIAAAYCLVRGILDLRKRAYAWGVLGIASAAIILVTPNPNNKVSVTIPITEPGH